MIAPIEELKYTSRIKNQIENIYTKYGESTDTPFKKLKKELLNDIMYGTNETVDVQLKFADVKKVYKIDFEGIIPYLENIMNDREDPMSDMVIKKFSKKIVCPDCQGYRLNSEALHFKIDNKHIGEVAHFDLQFLLNWLNTLDKKLNKNQKKIAFEILKEIKTRLGFLLDVGLNYLALDRPSRSLSGGEAQRIRLATQIGSQLVNVLYILDEPSIGLHQRDNVKLIDSLKKLRDIGNSVLVVEHDKDMIL